MLRQRNATGVNCVHVSCVLNTHHMLLLDYEKVLTYFSADNSCAGAYFGQIALIDVRLFLLHIVDDSTN